MGANTHQIKLLQGISQRLERTNEILGALLIIQHNKGVLKEEEVIRYLRISSAEFRKIIDNEELDYVILEGEKRYQWSDIQKYLDKLKPEKKRKQVGFSLGSDRNITE